MFAPNGRIFSLKQGSSAVDFAYAVHSKIGNYALSCEIDKKLAPLSTVLKSGQTIEIIKSKKKTVSPDWPIRTYSFLLAFYNFYSLPTL